MNIFSSINFQQPKQYHKLTGKEIVILISNITCEKDFSDTVNCISSIKNVFPNSKIAFVEFNSNYTKQLEQLCDYFIFCPQQQENNLFEINALTHFFTHLLDESTEIIHVIPKKSLHQDFNRDIMDNKFTFFPQENFSIPKQFFPHMLTILEKTKMYILYTGTTLTNALSLLPECLVNKF